MASALQAIADRFPGENVLVVSHGEVRVPCRLHHSTAKHSCRDLFHNDASSSVGVFLQAVGRAITRIMPHVIVYDVQHCGYAMTWREQEEDGDWGLWQLDETACRGVHWTFRGAD
jgi:hypothetical protein